MKSIMMMNNDLDFGGTGIVDGKLEIAQALELELGSSLQEWFLDDEYGTDFSVFQDKATAEDIELEVARVIANEERAELEGDITVTVEKSTRTANVAFIVREIETGEEIGVEVNTGGSNKQRLQEGNV